MTNAPIDKDKMEEAKKHLRLAANEVKAATQDKVAESAEAAGEKAKSGIDFITDKFAKMINKKTFSLLLTPVLAGAGVLLFLGGSQASADGLTQDSKITSISTSPCSDTAGYTVNIGGNFPSPIKNVAVNGIDIGSSNFMQFPDKLMINIPVSHQRTFTIDVFNWLLPMLDTQTFHCSGTGADTMVIPTRSGGILPMTGTNNYNFLLAGMVFSLLGASGLLLRRRVQS